MQTTPLYVAILCLACIYITQGQTIQKLRERYNDRKYLVKLCNQNCTVPEAACFLSIPGDCQHFIFCIPTAGQKQFAQAFKMSCAVGLVWNTASQGCARSENVARKCSDICSDMTVTKYAHDANCNQYYDCVLGVSEPRCCRKGYAFVNGECVLNDTCLWRCPVEFMPEEETPVDGENGTTTPKPETTTPICTREPIAGNKAGYRLIETNISTVCAPGAIFSPDLCECVLDDTFIPSSVCIPEVIIYYDNRARPADLTTIAVQEDFQVRKQNHVGRFYSKDQSASKIYHYSSNNNLLMHFNMTVIFKAESTGDQEQYLITNCRSVAVDRPSLGIIVDNLQGTLQFVADDNATAPYEDSIKMTLPFHQGSWNWVRYIFDGKTLEATVKRLDDAFTDPSMVPEEVYTNNVTLATPTEEPVTLLNSQNPLTVGYCQNRGFDGLIYLAQIAPWVCNVYNDSILGI